MTRHPTLFFYDKVILVTGSSGFIGNHLCRRLTNLGAKVVGVDLKPPRETIPGMTHVFGDVRALTRIDIPRVDSIFNFAAVHTTPGHADHEYYDTNVLGALETVKVAKRDRIDDITFTSSISIYGPSEDRKVESSEPAPVSAYGKSKWMAEEIHREWLADQPSAKLTIIRPAVVFGAGEGGNFARMAALLRKGFFVFPGRRDTIKSCIYVEDLLDLMLAAGAMDSSYNLLNGSYPECPTLETIVTTLQGEYFPQAKLIDLPGGAVMTAAKLLSALNGLGFGIHPDRVKKLVRSTYVYPEWAVQHEVAAGKTLAHGIERWATATQRSFV